MMNFKIFTALLIFSFSSIAQSYKGVAYMPAYRMSNLSNLNYDLITHVMASFANPNEQGDMSFAYDIDNFVSTVHANNAEAVISIGGGGDYSWGDKVVIYEDLLATSSSRTNFIHKIMNYLRDHDIDGLDNDIEGNALALANFNVFSQELGDSIHAQGLEYSAAIGVGGSWGVNYWDKATLDKLDFMMTMSYGGVGNWNWNVKNDDHTFAKMKEDMEYFTITKQIPKEKVIGGIPFYAVEFPNAAQSNYGNFHLTNCAVYQDPQFTSQNPLHNDTLTTTEGHTVYINSLETIYKKMDYCHSNGGGIMIWEAGQDCYDGSVNLIDSMTLHMTTHSLSTEHLFANKNILVYPNPSSGYLNIETAQKELMKVKVIDASGTTIKVSTKKNIDISELSPGFYFVVIELAKEGSVTRKIMLN